MIVIRPALLGQAYLMIIKLIVRSTNSIIRIFIIRIIHEQGKATQGNPINYIILFIRQV